MPSQGEIDEALTKLTPIRFLPDHSLYFTISTKEKLSRLLKPSAQKKSQFDLQLSGKRLKEAYLLLGKDDTKKASINLKRYAQKINDFESQINKADSQNQDISKIIDQAAEDLKHHETLIILIEHKGENRENTHNFDENLSLAQKAFTDAINTLDSLKPGVKNRFKTTRE